MRLGVADDLLATRVGSSLALALALGLAAGVLEAFHQLVAGRRELGKVGDAARGQKRWMGMALRSRLGVGGQLGLQAGDLAAKLPASRCLVGLDADIGRLAFGRQRVISCPACRVDRARDIAWRDAFATRLRDGLGRDALDV